ncbi:unnamed protein product [Phytophthora fragariaefolia]|uniref:Unnamed protein product n=1 Tax=Phytophthora fragariaefolia TaxID=1490495 RepID=A0A9W6YAM4_9STRA|nr:unnamed protein product [Phytophthora fragariaefolia]
MDLVRNDHLLEPNDDNQSLSSGEFNFQTQKFAGNDVDLSALDYEDEISRHLLASERNTNASMEFPVRKVHSAAPTFSGFGGNSAYEDIPRPYTAVGADAPPPTSNRGMRHRKKHSTVQRKTARRSDDRPEDRPRSADVNEWGDFDTDRLLRDESTFPEDRSNQNSLDPLDEQRSRSRKNRRSTPAKSSPRPSPWEGYLYLNNEKESSRPIMQVLRQKPIEILNLDLVPQTSHTTAKANMMPKPLLGRASLERLISTRSRPTTSYASRPTTPAPLFGTEISDTPKNRAAIFGRFAGLWSLILNRPNGQPSGAYIDDKILASDVQTRSPFECSITMVKLCKSVGISLTPSAATHLSFWYTNEQGVEFEPFCELVIQGAIQPALHHFNLDNSVDEYVGALDTIIQSLVTATPVRRYKSKSMPPECPRRLKELDEIQPVFMSWKAGITPRLVQPSEDPGPPATRALVTAERVRKALEASASQHMLAHQLPSEEARVTHADNIRRKIQLHKSWKFISGGKIVDRISTPSDSASRDIASSKQDEWKKFADLSEMLEQAHSVLRANTASDEALIGEEGHHPEVHAEHSGFGNTEPEMDAAEKNDEALVCCTCSIRGAVLWCSSCFTVNCQKCWQEAHSCTVDMSIVLAEPTSTKKPLLGPTALALKKKRCGSASLKPPVAMIYLPTKAMVPGALARGNPIVRHNRKNCNQVALRAAKDEVPTVIATSMLPSLYKTRSDAKLSLQSESLQSESPDQATDSTADLMMLRMSPSTSTPSSHPTGSNASTESLIKMHKHHLPSRPKLPLAPVSLDAELLLSSTPDRRR